MMHPPKRVQILLKIDELQNEHCKDCEKTKSVDGNGRNAICNNQCDVGKKLQHLGQLLLENKAKKIKKKPEYNFKVVKKEMTKVAKELTKETFLQLSDEGKTNKEIMKMFGLNNAKFYKLKNDWGLVNRKFSKTKQDQPEKKVQSTADDKRTKEIQELKAELDKMKDNHPVPVEEKVVKQQCDCKVKLQEQLLSLQSELAQQKRLNDDLAQSISVLQKYKSMYFSTVEALKIHLP